jgi:uncharacterized membrane protein
LIVPRSDVRELKMSVDNALKYVISMGVVAPIEPISASIEKPSITGLSD